MYTGAMAGFYKLSNWIMRFAYVNVLWIIFSLVGLIIFGFFPATTAMFNVIRKWVQGHDDLPIFETFWKTYRKKFLKSNLLGLIIFMIGCILYIDMISLRQSVNGFLQFAYYPLLLMILLFFLTLLYVFPVFVYYEAKLLQVIKNAFLIMIMSPLITFMMMVSVVIVFYFLQLLPGLSLFFSGSVLAYVITWSFHFAFVKIQRLQVENAKESEEQQKFEG